MKYFRKLIKLLIPRGLFRKVEPYGHLIEAVLANIRYGFPARNMQVIGVTGTNGKTTTTLMIHKLLSSAGYRVGVLSTVAVGVGEDIVPRTEHMTTDKPSILQRHLRDFKKAGVGWVIVEVSSHSLAQHRVWGIPFEIAVLTNITEDHLDYHGTFERYLRAKRRLFKIAARHGRRLGIVNADDSNSDRFADAVPLHVSYGLKQAEVQAENIKTSITHSTYTAKAGRNQYKIRVNIPGKFNVSNSLAAVAVGRELGLSRSQIEKGIASLSSVAGRMQTVHAGQKFGVMVDFASTPDGFEKFFETVRPQVKGKLVAVFGSAGERDKAKRSQQGEIAGKYAGEVVLTEEDDRSEDGHKILEKIAAGAQKAGLKLDKTIHLVHNREEAIGFALTRVSTDKDMVVLLGKGHEKTIERFDGEHPWDEVGMAVHALEALQQAKKATKSKD
jgi:UDP-N-acetylmuramoyl-L-alanyl-D-glutamate--2,6-diaminopimelate ligase